MNQNQPRSNSIWPIKTILHPPGFSDRSQDAFRLACCLTRHQAARLIVLHVTTLPDLAYKGYGAPGSPLLAQEYRRKVRQVLERLQMMAATATRGAVCFPRRMAELLRAGLGLRDRHAPGEISRRGLAVARGRLENQLSDLIFPPKTNAANERLAQHLWNHGDELFTFLRQPGLDATNWRAELAIRFGVILRKVWGGSRTWAGARAQSVLMSVWRTCWQQGRSALDFLSHLLRGTPMALALPPCPTAPPSGGTRRPDSSWASAPNSVEALVLGLQVVDASLTRLAAGTPNRFHAGIMRTSGTCSCGAGR
jgi:transposase